MAVVAIKEYKFPAKDTQDKFHGNQLLYVGWDDHLMFCAPFTYCLSPDTRFDELCEKYLSGSYSRHPDWAKIDFKTATWLKSGKPWQPDMSKTLAEQGLKHKDALRLQTPGLNGINGTGF